VKSIKKSMRWRAEEGKRVPSYTCLQPKDSAVRNTRGCHMPSGEAMYPGPTLALLQLATTRPPGCIIHDL
jgi:hypothetical protein